jgi:hypothetical protein
MLKLCPFCNGEAHLFNPDKFKNVTVRCSQCGVQTAPIMDHKGASVKAIEAWNRRDTSLESRLADTYRVLSMVQSWWLSEGMHQFNGAPYAMFAVRSILDGVGTISDPLKKEISSIREILAGGDIASLPRDNGTAAMAANRMDEISKLRSQFLDTCSRAEKAEQALREIIDLVDDPACDADPEESTIAFAKAVLAKAESK